MRKSHFVTLMWLLINLDTLCKHSAFTATDKTHFGQGQEKAVKNPIQKAEITMKMNSGKWTGYYDLRPEQK